MKVIPYSSGSDPNDPSDNSAPDNCVTFKLTVGDPSGSHSERWEMHVIDDKSGKELIHHCDEDFGTPGSREYALVKGKSYTFKLRHVGTDPYSTYPSLPDYDWCCLINDSTETGVRQGLYGTGPFIVEDPDGLLTQITYGGLTDLTLGKQGKIIVPGIVTETEFTSPPNRSRKTIGVGEVVNLSISADLPSSAIVWMRDDGIVMNPYLGSQTTFTAPDRENYRTVTAYFNGLPLHSVTFHTIEPDDILFENNSVHNSCAPPAENYFRIEYCARTYLRPTTVNFGMITLLEGYAVTQTEPGYFRDYPPNSHSQWPYPISLVDDISGTWVEGKGTLVNWTQGGDLPGGLTHNVYQFPLRDGYAWWDLPWMFCVGDGAFKTFKTVKQDFRVIGSGANGLFRITKGASGAEIKTGDAEAYLITP